MNVRIFTFYMPNIDPKTVEMQRRVVARFNPKGYPHLQVPVMFSHADSIDLYMNWPADIYVLLDVDCIPLSDTALEDLVTIAARGYLTGNIQRSNHIENGEHVFVAPSACAISAKLYAELGRPSAKPTDRGDVCEEWTYACERLGRPMWFLDVKGFEDRPAECESWALGPDMPHYGLGTTFGNGHDAFYHRFQIRMPGQQERFRARCERALAC